MADKLVPEIPTQEMLRAAAGCHTLRNEPTPEFLAKLWRAMHDAAPAAVAPEAPREPTCGCSDYELCVGRPDCKRFRRSAAPAEAPQGDDLAARLRSLHIMDEVGSDNPLGRDAAARIESDAATIAARDREIARLNGAITYWRDATEHTLDRATERLRADLAASSEREQAFQTAIRDLFRAMDWPYCRDLDGFAFQEWAEKHGFLREEQRSSFCGENCWCSECHGDPEGGFTCYRKIEWLATPDSAPQQEQTK